MREEVLPGGAIAHVGSHVGSPDVLARLDPPAAAVEVVEVSGTPPAEPFLENRLGRQLIAA